MPLTHYRCPDKNTISITDCLRACRLPQRCLTRTTLQVIAETQRPWDDIPHVTQLLNGTMLELLKITKDYTISPKDRAFALLGSSHHRMLDGGWSHETPEFILGAQGYISELSLNNGWMQGTLDLLEDGGTELIMTDYKTWGSSRLCRGKSFDPAQVDLTEVSMQMNAYRVMLEQQYDIKAGHLQVQCTVRDGGLAATIRRGVTESMYLLPVSKLPDEVVLAYFRTKAELLLDALAKDGLPEPCSNIERWNDVRCRRFCEVAEYCPVGVQYE